MTTVINQCVKHQAPYPYNTQLNDPNENNDNSDIIVYIYITNSYKNSYISMHTQSEKQNHIKYNELES